MAGPLPPHVAVSMPRCRIRFSHGCLLSRPTARIFAEKKNTKKLAAGERALLLEDADECIALLRSCGT